MDLSTSNMKSVNPNETWIKQWDTNLIPNHAARFGPDDRVDAFLRVTGEVSNSKEIAWGPTLTSDPIVAEKGDKLVSTNWWYNADLRDAIFGQITLTNLDTGKKYVFSATADNFDWNNRSSILPDVEIPESGRYTISYRVGARDDSGDGRITFVDLHIGNISLVSELRSTDHEYTFDKKQFLAGATDPEYESRPRSGPRPGRVQRPLSPARGPSSPQSGTRSRAQRITVAAGRRMSGPAAGHRRPGTAGGG
ncbi:MAG: hypothetical protein FWJ87_12060, partial [Micromonosporaceae bacterium]